MKKTGFVLVLVIALLCGNASAAAGFYSLKNPRDNQNKRPMDCIQK